MAVAITQDGVALSYQTHGRGEALVLLAGQANTHRWWDGIRQDFEDDYHTITFDYRGTGASDKPDMPYSTRGFATDVIAVLDDLGIDRAHVYGTSMGGRVAQWLAADHPDKVGSLVLGCTSPGGKHGIERDNTVKKSLAQPDRQAAARALLELMYTPEWLATHPGPHNTIGDPDMPGFTRRRHLAASTAHDAWDVLPGITAPTLVIHGTDDLFNPAANAPLLAGRIPGARMHAIPGARHAYFEEFRELASPAVLDFLTDPTHG
ncbi:alpha/beta fold hydrolase [Actinomadura sp. HBU206391]|uniref:alpha/beta fold hydrolase n=1 Tax=Actinomadura sp. HBU206391 TaxID=2731692 RepID=UPI00164F9BFF|nr:alpha/beta fold hydrolase [Actinomadura sp. HBU206391]MBC6462869.1 alpha/beta fold hydrolase [Actinomadura sp. HBU206391]